jgi:hypothetical protein
MSELHSGERRRHIRFKPGSVNLEDLEARTREAIAHIGLDPDQAQFAPEVTGFVIEQSHSGCSLVLVRAKEIYDELNKGKLCVIQVGPLSPMKAVVRWRKDLDESVFKVGFQYLD